MRRSPFRPIALAALIAAASTSSPRSVHAQFVVWDPGNFAQAVTDYTMRGLEYALQGLEYAEAVQGVIHLAKQIDQLDSTYFHAKEKAMGRIGQIQEAFAALSITEASTFLDTDFGSWRNRLEGGAGDIVAALEEMEDGSLSDYLIGDLAGADVVGAGTLIGLYPGARGTRLADNWTEGRETGDRLRAGDYATAEAAGRLTTLLKDAQVDIDGRRDQAELSHTALQQAQLANQLTTAELDMAIAQLHAVQAQQTALARHEAELRARAEAERWVQRERDRRTLLQRLQAAEDSRVASNRLLGRLPERSGN